MAEMIRVLLVEKSQDEAAAVVAQLQKAGYEVFSVVAEDAEKMKMALDRQGWNVVICGTDLPRFDWQRALKMAREVDPEVPFILISKVFDEKVVAQAMKAGVNAYLTKDHLAGLPLAVAGELSDSLLRRERRQAAEKVEKLQAFREVSGRINRHLVRVRTEQELFERVVECLAELPGIRLVWIGVVQEGSAVVKPVAQKGYESGYLSTIRVTRDDSEYGRGPTGVAIRTGKPSVMRDIREDIRFRPWRDEALKRGYASSIAVPLIHEEQVIGALNLYSERRDAFDEAEVSFLTEIAADVAVGLRTLRLEEKMREACSRLHDLLDEVLAAFSLSVEQRIPGMTGDGRKVADLSCRIAQVLGWDADRIRLVRLAAYLHDAGMAAVPAGILARPDALTEEEFASVTVHCAAGRELLSRAGLPWPVAEVVFQHHERMDGSGYPSGLSGKEILPEARVVSVADVFVAMESDRPHRQAPGRPQAIQELTAGRGTLYDPDVVDACLRAVQEMQTGWKPEPLL